MLWCSELTYFLDLLGNNVELDNDYMASYLMATEPQGKTPYRQVACVQPGYVTVVGVKDVTHRQLWSAASCISVTLESDADYEERFRELFAQSIQRRLRVPEVTIAELSGGLDSSSVVCMADRLLDASGTWKGKLQTVSYLHDGSRGADERYFIAEVEQSRNVETHLIQDRNIVPLSAARTTYLPSFASLFSETYKSLREIMESINASVLLCGLGGDEVGLSETSICPNLSRLFKRGHFLKALRASRTWAQAHKTTMAEILWTSAISPLLPIGLQRVPTPGPLFPASWMGPALATRLKSWQRHVKQGRAGRLADPVRRQQSDLLKAAASVTSQCSYRAHGCGDVTYPFLDRCLIEFLIGIPADQKLRPTESRSIHRRAMKDILPEKIRLRKTKQGPGEPLLRALARDWQAVLNIFQTSELHKRGFIDCQSFLPDLIRAKHGICPFTASLARILSLELWLRAHGSERSHTMMDKRRQFSYPPATPIHDGAERFDSVHHSFVEASTKRR